MFSFKGLSAKMLGMVAILALGVLLVGCCPSYRCGSPCGSPCGNPCGNTSWPNGSIELGFCPNKGCNSGCYDPCYPFAKSSNGYASAPKSGSAYEDSGYLSDAEAGGSGTSSY
ncbi:hypothetical protein L6Q85_11030 [bacterium]|nr:hypothetical protein [bacterium]MCK6496779.1 hypothetical protein [bacterium]